MTVAQTLSVVAALDTAWQITAVAAWLSCAAFLGAVVVARWEDVSEDARCLAAALPVRRATGRHHHGGGRHRADRIQHPGAAEKLDGPPTSAPARPAPTGGAR